jgi:ABC-type glycerol-3-phosphate transport system substrate-binding protein
MKTRMLLAAGAVLALLPAPAMAAETVTFWQFSTNQNDIDAWNGAIKAFEAKSPDIQVNMEIVPWASQQQRLVTALTTGGLPDVSMLGNNVVAQFQATGSLAPLDPYFADYDKANNTKVEDDVWPGDKGYYHLGGHWWASPIAVETRALYYRKDLFKAAGLDPAKPPQTWDELRADAKALTAAAKDGTKGIALSMSLDYFTVQNFMSAWLGYGAHMLDDKGQCGFDTPEFKQALDVYVGMFKDGSTSPDAATTSGDTFRRGFLDGKYAMILLDPSLYRDLVKEKAPFLNDIGIAEVPAGPTIRAGFLGGWPLVLWNTSEHKDAAAKWIMFATHDGLKSLATAGGFIPGNITLAHETPWTDFPYPLFVKQLQDAKPYQFPAEAIPQMGQLEVDTVQKAIQAVALGKQDDDQATKTLCDNINAVLSR